MVTDQAASTRPSSALLAALPAVVGIVLAFVSAIVQYAAIAGGETEKLTGLDGFLGLPSVGVSIVLFSVFVTWFVGAAARAVYTQRLYLAVVIVAGLATAYQLAALVLNFSAVALVLLVAIAVVLLFTIAGFRAAKGIEPQVGVAERRRIFGVVLVVTGLAGLTAAYNLSVDKVTVILSPSTTLNCNVSPIVACGKNLGSWQGALFGFPNPLIGLGGFAVVLVVGIAVLAGVRFARWWWIAFNVCVAAAFAFITFLIISSVYVIGSLCLWCALVWSVTIPTFWLTTIGNLKDGTFTVGPGATKFFASVYTWIPLITLVCYLAVALIFQLRLGLFTSL